MARPYCTLADLLLLKREEELVQLTVDDDVSTEVDEDVLGRAIQRAGNRIDAIAGAHFDIPFDPTPGFIRDLCCDLTLVLLAERRSSRPTWAESSREQVDADLERLAEGEFTTGQRPDAARNPERGPLSVAPDRTFDSDTMAGF